MGGVSLLQQARATGLAVTAENGRLRIRGPKRAEAVAHRLIEHKAVVLAVLVHSAHREPVGEPAYRGPGVRWSVLRPQIAWLQAWNACALGPAVGDVTLEPDADSAGVPKGWRRESWVSRLRYLAGQCERDHPVRAAELRAEADSLDARARRAPARPTDGKTDTRT
ncbi:MAG: hypothetical protein ACYSUI_08050 [Planctomycetota bacterium]